MRVTIDDLNVAYREYSVSWTNFIIMVYLYKTTKAYPVDGFRGIYDAIRFVFAKYGTGVSKAFLKRSLRFISWYARKSGKDFDRLMNYPYALLDRAFLEMIKAEEDWTLERFFGRVKTIAESSKYGVLK